MSVPCLKPRTLKGALRSIRRLVRDLKFWQGFFTCEGNKGGSVIEITKTEKDGFVRLKVGHQCVWRFAKTVDVAELTEYLASKYDDGTTPRFDEGGKVIEGNSLAEKLDKAAKEILDATPF